MTQPTLTAIALREATCSETQTILDLVVRVAVPPARSPLRRPPINLGLAIDRSVSMQGRKLSLAIEAACFAVRQLSPTDRVSITVFGDRATVPVTSTLANDPQDILRKIEAIAPRGGSALLAGWQESVAQVKPFYRPDSTNLVLVLSDGSANLGETNPDSITFEVDRWARQGITTSAIGTGPRQNADLLAALARGGRGRYAALQSIADLPSIFQAEFQQTTAHLLDDVSLSFEPEADVSLIDVFNEPDECDGLADYPLPNLLSGDSVDVALRLKILPNADRSHLCRFHLHWKDSRSPQRQSLQETLSLPAVTATHLSEFSANREVSDIVAEFMKTRAKAEKLRGEKTGSSHQIDETAIIELITRLLASYKNELQSDRQSQSRNEGDRDSNLPPLARSNTSAKFRRKVTSSGGQ